MMQRVSFTEEMDLLMLREVVACQAFLRKAGQGWKIVTEVLLQLPPFPGFMTNRTVRDRTNLLLAQYKRDILGNDRRSDIKEEISEKAALLQEILVLKSGGRNSILEERKGEEYDNSTTEAVGELSVIELSEDVPGTSSDQSSSSINSPAHSCDHFTDFSPTTGKKRKMMPEDTLHHLESRESRRRLESLEDVNLKRMELEMERARQQEEFDLKRMEFDLKRERQEEEFRLRREREEFDREERKAFLDIMKIFAGKLNK